MSDRSRWLLLALHIGAGVFVYAGAIRQYHQLTEAHRLVDRAEAMRKQGPCVPFREGMTLEPGQCAILTIPIDPDQGAARPKKETY